MKDKVEHIHFHQLVGEESSTFRDRAAAFASTLIPDCLISIGFIDSVQIVVWYWTDAS